LQISGEQKYLWRAVEQNGTALDVLVQNRRATLAGRRFFCRLLTNTGVGPGVVVADKLRSYGAAYREVIPPWSTAHPRA
jgi:putative transposase